MVRTSMRCAAVLALALVPLAACGDDSSSASSDTLSQSEKTAFCKIAKTLTDSEDFPTPAQVAEYRAHAPASLDDELDIVEPAIKKHADDKDPTGLIAAFAADDFEDAINRMDVYETKTCDIDHSDDQAEAKVDPSANRVDVTAKEYSFDLPGSIPAGSTSLVLKSGGAQAHFMFVQGLAPGHTLDELAAYEGDDSTGAGITTDVQYGSRLAAPGGDDQEVVNADLPAGTYVISCFLPSPDGQPHSALGMQRTFTVT